MQELGQFDTVYHEHISFFTGHSFRKAAELAGLEVVSFETTPIHGESCLVTMKLGTATINKGLRAKINDAHDVPPTLKDRLAKEKDDGITSDFFAMRFSSHANSIREWMQHELLQFKSKDYTVGGYGAAAKGMVLLHYVIGSNNDGSSYLDFVLDDAELKQNIYCPGTVIPVLPTSSLLQLCDSEKPLVMLIFAWNFFDEIAKKVVGALKGSSHKGVTFLVPFPVPRVIFVDMTAAETKHQLLRKLSLYPTPIPNPITNDGNRTKVLMVTHQRNEEVLMPFFIMHHAPMFDKVILIDFEKDDDTLEVVKRFAPPSWEIVKSSTGKVFDAIATDQQVMNQGKMHPDYWQIALTTTEFLVAPDFRQTLSSVTKDEIEKAKSFVTTVPIFSVDGNNTAPLVYSRPLPKQRFMGHFYKDARDTRPVSCRFIHYKTTSTHSYGVGRHAYNGEGNSNFQFNAVIMKFSFAPWPELKVRKRNVGATIPADNVRKGMGAHHTKRLNEEALDNEYLAWQERITSNLCKANEVKEFYVHMSSTFHGVFPEVECD